MDASVNKQLLEKLDVIVKLLASDLVIRYKTDGEKVLFLSSLNLSIEDIALILNKTKDQVSKLKYVAKKRNKLKRRGKR